MELHDKHVNLQGFQQSRRIVLDLENWWARTVLITPAGRLVKEVFVRCSGFCPYVLLSFTINSYKISRITVILYVCSATIILDEVKHLLGRRRASFAG